MLGLKTVCRIITCYFKAKKEDLNTLSDDVLVVLLHSLPECPHGEVGNGSSPLPIPDERVQDQEVPAD